MTTKVSKKESLEKLKQILFQLEQFLKDSDDDKKKEISRHIRNTKAVIAAISVRD